MGDGTYVRIPNSFPHRGRMGLKGARLTTSTTTSVRPGTRRRLRRALLTGAGWGSGKATSGIIADIVYG